VTLVPASRVQDALRRMHREPGTSLTEPVALELAVREGLRAVLVGDVTSAGGQVVLTARLIGPDGGTLASMRQTAAPDAVIQGADRLSAAIRERLGESLRSIRAAEPLAQVTTPSLEALRKYSQGVRAYDSEPETRKAIVLLQEAIEQDSAFAMAWRKLGVAYQWVDEDSMRLAIEQAFRHRDRLSERERRLTEGTYYQMVASDTARAMVAYEASLERHPDEPTALNNLAMLRSAQGDAEGAAELYARALETSGTPTARRNMAYILARLKRYDDLEQVLSDYEDRFPDHFQGPQFRGALAAHRFDYATARDYFQRAMEMNERAGGFALTSMLMIEGKHAAALRRIRDDRADATQEEMESELEFTAAFMDVFHRFDPGAARDRIERLATEERLQAMAVEDRPYMALGMVNLFAGEVARAERWVERWRTERPEDFDPLEGPASEITREIAAARGEPTRLIRDLQRQAADGCHPCWFHLARAYEGAAMPDSAVVAYETYLDPPQPPLFRVNTDRLFLPAALQRAAALHEDAGRSAEAAAHYSRFIELWKDADPELQPRVEAARRALARMTAERPGG
jgi:eukaryotic-like serine/threonine-protein kinase